MGAVTITAHAESCVEFFGKWSEGHQGGGGEGIEQLDFSPDEGFAGESAWVGSGEEEVDVVKVYTGEGEDTRETGS